MPSSLLPLSVLLALPAAAQALDRDVAGDLDADPAPLVVRLPLSALPRPVEKPPERPGPAVLPTSLRIGVVPGDETALDLDLTVATTEEAVALLDLFGDALAVRDATIDGRPARLAQGRGGWRALVLDGRPGAHRVRIRGTVATPGPSLDLPLLVPPRTRVEVAGDWEIASPGGLPAADSGGRALQLPPGERLALSWQPPRPATPRPQIVRASSGVDLQVDSAGVTGRARMRFVVVDQPAQTLSFRLSGGTDLDVTGAAVSGFTRSGDTVQVTLVRPIEGAVTVEVAWRATAPGASAAAVAVPVPVTSSGVLDEGWVTVRGGDQGTVVPDAGRGLAAVPVARVPAWAQGMVPGNVVTALALTGSRPELRLSVLDLSPIEAPPTFVDEARFEVAYAEHGRALLRATLDVRNDRSQYLPIDLPPGAVLLGVRVAGRVVQPVRGGTPDGAQGGQDRLYVPLEKSVETLSGLVAFPVELGLLLPDDPWAARGERQLTLPGIHAPVAQARWELLLPPGVAVRDVSGDLAPEADLETRTTTLAYGRAVATKSLAVDLENDRRAQDDAQSRSREAWNSAYRAYQDNEFEAARGMLEQSLAWDQDNEAAHQLLDNVQVLLGEDEEAARSDQSRRIRAMARSKLAGAESEQLELKDKAQEAVRAGDYVQAEQALDELRSLTERLVQVEDLEVVDQKVALEETEKQLAEVRAKRDEEDSRRRGEVEALQRREAELTYKAEKKKEKVAGLKGEAAQTAASADSFASFDGLSLSYEEDAEVEEERYDLPAEQIQLDEGEVAVVFDRRIVLDENMIVEGRAYNSEISGDTGVELLSSLGYLDGDGALMAAGDDATGETFGFGMGGLQQAGQGGGGMAGGGMAGGGDFDGFGETFEGGEYGYVEGGVEGGVVGGVLGGAAGGVAYGAVAVPEVPEEPEPMASEAPMPAPMPVAEPVTMTVPMAAAPASPSTGSYHRVVDADDAPADYDEDVYWDDIDASSVRATGASISRCASRNEVLVVERAKPRLRLPSLASRKEAPPPPPPPPSFPVGDPVEAAKPVGAPVVHAPPVGPLPGTARPVGPRITETHPYGPMVAPPQTSPDALDMDPAVTAAPLLRPVPRAGDRIALVRQLVPDGQALTVTLSYKTRSRD
ncbi:MAG: hypothetical protein H6742_17525 [Alphaproteobacteria bacterium]|nr:hypothetical protein [Alphaproteobacteria bacterium]